MEIGFVFPGQGSQYVGMGKDLISSPLALEIFDVVKENLGKDLRSLCVDGLEEELGKTINTQTTVFVVSYICLELLRNIGIGPDIVAGHSLGEYSALVASGVIEFNEGLQLVAKRAKLMQEVAEKMPGAMIAVLGLDMVEVSRGVEGLRDEGVINIANYNCPGQLVVSGEKGLIKKAEDIFKRLGAKRVVFLPVEGAFHTSMMSDAEKKLEDALRKAPFRDAKVPLVSNSTAQISTDKGAIREALSCQMTSPVLWQQSIEKMLQAGVKTFVEVGPRQVLSGLVKRIDGTANVLNVESEISLANVRAVLKQ